MLLSQLSAVGEEEAAMLIGKVGGVTDADDDKQEEDTDDETEYTVADEQDEMSEIVGGKGERKFFTDLRLGFDFSLLLLFKTETNQGTCRCCR